MTIDATTAQITVIPGVEQRRHWNDDQILALIEAAMAPGASVAAMARGADVATSSINRWRRELCGILVKPKGFADVAVRANPASSCQCASGMPVIEINGATNHANNATSPSLLVSALAGAQGVIPFLAGRGAGRKRDHDTSRNARSTRANAFSLT